jgi:hypothetical protein
MRGTRADSHAHARGRARCGCQGCLLGQAGCWLDDPVRSVPRFGERLVPLPTDRHAHAGGGARNAVQRARKSETRCGFVSPSGSIPVDGPGRLAIATTVGLVTAHGGAECTGRAGNAVKSAENRGGGRRRYWHDRRPRRAEPSARRCKGAACAPRGHTNSNALRRRAARHPRERCKRQVPTGAAHRLGRPIVGSRRRRIQDHQNDRQYHDREQRPQADPHAIQMLSATNQ